MLNLIGQRSDIRAIYIPLRFNKLVIMKMRLVRKLLLIPFIALLLSVSTTTVWAQAVIHNYIDRYKELAESLSQEYCIPASVILGVAIVESSAGKGPAVVKLNNHFGIEGKNTLVQRGKGKSRYKEYDCDSCSYEDFCKLLTRKKFYANMKTQTNPKLWVDAISKAHYSEVPDAWKKKVMTAINAYHLQSL